MRNWKSLSVLQVVGWLAFGSPAIGQQGSPDIAAELAKSSSRRLNGRIDGRLALVIGNASYSHASDTPNADDDAEQVARTLNRIGFTVMHRSNLSDRQMFEAIEDFRNELRVGGIGVFYYAGHAVELSGKNYLVPVNLNPLPPSGSDSAAQEQRQQLMKDTVSVAYVMDSLSKAGVDSSVVILDACRNDPVRGLVRVEDSGNSDFGGLPPETLFAFATRPGDTASDNGDYARALVRHIVEPGLTINEVFINVAKTMKEKGLQEPRLEHNLTDPPILVEETSNVAPWILGGLGAAGLGVAVVYGVMALSTFDHAEELCPPDQQRDRGCSEAAARTSASPWPWWGWGSRRC
jgi:uncharacterized caspase-like protein